jgi:hypothetical protein
MSREREPDEIGSSMLRFADRETNGPVGRRQAGQQRTQFLEGIGLKLQKARVHERSREPS